MFATHTKIKQARIARKWSQAQLAVFAEIGVGDVSRIESGRMRPYPSQAQKLSRVLNIPVNELQEPVQLEAAAK